MDVVRNGFEAGAACTDPKEESCLMKKKLVLALLMATLLAGGAFAQEKFFSAGGGLLLVPSFGKITVPYMGGDMSIKTSRFGIGVNAFFDAKYAELNVGLLFGRQKQEVSGYSSSEVDLSEITLGLIGKYPFSIGEKFVIFPFAGLDVNFNLAAKSDGEDVTLGDYSRAEYFTSLSILFGVGFDFSITQSIYLRAEAGYGIVFNSKYMQDMVDDYDAKITQGKVPIKIAVGFRF